jgi:putative ABC transport system permease protein
MKTIYIMLVITIAVMGLALTNFINLYILNGSRRSREIGIRKVTGAGRRALIRQFYLETLVVVSIAFVVGALLAYLLLPSFARVMQRESFTSVTGTSGLYLVLTGIYLITVLLSGFYPALLLSRAAPVPLIRGAVNPAGDKRLMLRLVSMVQVCIAVSLLAILLGINTQIRFLKNYSPGYKPEYVVQVSNLNETLVENYPALKDKLLGQSAILEVAASSHMIGRGTSGQGIRLAAEPPEKIRSIREYRVRPGLCQLYQFNLLAGRYLEDGRATDDRGLILNEAAVKMLGFTPEEIIGESLVMHRDPLLVTGVVEDFLYSSAARTVEPLVITAYSEFFRNISVRYAPGQDPQEVLRIIQESIREFDPEYIMLATFQVDTLKSYYHREQRLQKIILAGSLLALLIVLLGIYALVSHHLVARTKEIGIRKVMGASSVEMLVLIYSSTLRWTLGAAILAIPLAVLYLRNWLTDFAVRINLYWWIFVAAIITVVLFQSLITLGQTRRTARRDPVESLRYE